jgi:hypothetical protein
MCLKKNFNRETSLWVLCVDFLHTLHIATPGINPSKGNIFTFPLGNLQHIILFLDMVQSCSPALKTLAFEVKPGFKSLAVNALSNKFHFISLRNKNYMII